MANGGAIIFVIQAILACAILAAGLAVAWGLLSARRWAWWLDVGLSVLLCLACLTGVAAIMLTSSILEAEGIAQELASDPTATPEEKSVAANFVIAITAAYLMPMVVGILLSITSLAALFHRRTRDWLAFARNLRQEHRQLKESLS